MSQLQKSKF